MRDDAPVKLLAAFAPKSRIDILLSVPASGLDNDVLSLTKSTTLSHGDGAYSAGLKRYQ
jgi:hypothetical protein